MFEYGVYAAEKTWRLGLTPATMLAVDEQVDEDRHERPGEHVRGDHGEYDRQRLRGEQVFCHIGQENDRDEGGADRQSGNQSGLGDPRRALHDGLAKRSTFLE